VKLKADLLLLLAAAIWGFAFVAQRAGMAHLGPFTFNALRFGLGAVVLLPFLLGARRRGYRAALPGGAQAGLALFLGASLQQWGLVHTSAGKAGFITGLYVIIVPVLGIAEGRRTGWGTWLGAACALLGLFLLSVRSDLRMDYSELLLTGGALLWAIHVLVIARWTPRHDALVLAGQQFAVVALLSAAAALVRERGDAMDLAGAALPVLYAGLLSTAVAFTLQVVAQREAPPAHAAVLLSLEAVFAALGGWWLLGETLTPRGLAGCALMFAGMLASQLLGRPRDRAGNGKGAPRGRALVDTAAGRPRRAGS
jgi:drug/metabolite transporter (DMT)-like permease